MHRGPRARAARAPPRAREARRRRPGRRARAPLDQQALGRARRGPAPDRLREGERAVHALRRLVARAGPRARAPERHDRREEDVRGPRARRRRSRSPPSGRCGSSAWTSRSWTASARRRRCSSGAARPAPSRLRSTPSSCPPAARPAPSPPRPAKLGGRAVRAVEPGESDVLFVVAPSAIPKLLALEARSQKAFTKTERADGESSSPASRTSSTSPRSRRARPTAAPPRSRTALPPAGLRLHARLRPPRARPPVRRRRAS